MAYCLVIQGLDENNVRCIKTRFDFPYVIRHVAHFNIYCIVFSRPCTLRASCNYICLLAWLELQCNWVFIQSLMHTLPFVRSRIYRIYMFVPWLIFTRTIFVLLTILSSLKLCDISDFKYVDYMVWMLISHQMTIFFAFKNDNWYLCVIISSFKWIKILLKKLTLTVKRIQ